MSKQRQAISYYTNLEDERHFYALNRITDVDPCLFFGVG